MLDERELTEIYDRYSRELFTYIFGFVRNRESAEDILHDAFLRLMRYSSQYPLDTQNIRAFLYRTAHNLCIDQARKNRKETVYFGTDNIQYYGDDPQENLEKNELQIKVQSLLATRDSLSRSVYLMRVELNMKYSEIATALEISERTAKRKMKGIIEFLAGALEKSGFKLFMVIFLSLILIKIVLLM